MLPSASFLGVSISPSHMRSVCEDLLSSSFMQVAYYNHYGDPSFYIFIE